MTVLGSGLEFPVADRANGRPIQQAITTAAGHPEFFGVPVNIHQDRQGHNALVTTPLCLTGVFRGWIFFVERLCHTNGNAFSLG